MRKVRYLINLIKVNTTAQIVTGVVAASIVGAGVTTGVMVYRYHEVQNERASEEFKKQERADEMIAYCEEMRVLVSKLIESSGTNTISIRIQVIEDDYIERDSYETFQTLKKGIDEDYKALVEENEELMIGYRTDLGIKDFSKHLDGTESKVKEIIKEFDALEKDKEYRKAHAKFVEGIGLIDTALKPVEELKEPENTIADAGDSSNGGTTNNSTTNNSTTNNSSTNNSTTEKPSNNGTTEKPSTAESTPTPIPTPTPTPTPSRGYTLGKSNAEWFAGKGYDLYAIGLDNPFYLSHLDTWCIMTLYSESSLDYAKDLLGSNFPEEGLLITNGVCCGSMDSGEAIYLYRVHK